MSHPVEPPDETPPLPREMPAPDESADAAPGAVLVDASGVAAIDEQADGQNDGPLVARADATDDSAADDAVDEDAEATRDWRWIQEWRDGREPTPWAYGVGVAVFAALLAMVGVIALSSSLAAQPWLAVVVNLVVAGGIAPALWLCRGLPVLRWVGVGVAAGLVLGWIGSLAVVVPA